MGDNNQQTSKFVLLENKIPASYKQRLLGCVVNDVANPSSSFLPDFSLRGSPANAADKELLRQDMGNFLVASDSHDDGGFRNEVELLGLRMERAVASDTRTSAHLTKLLKLHYSREQQRDFDITAAKGKRYHLHNAANEFQDKLWSNKYYREAIDKTIEQKRQKGTLKTLAKHRKEFNVNRSPHTCEVVLLPIVVGILTCEKVEVNFKNNHGTSAGGALEIPVDEMAGLNTGRMLDSGVELDRTTSDTNQAAETIPGEVIVALAYDLVAVSTNRLDPVDQHTGKAHTPSASPSFLDRVLGRSKGFQCEECERAKPERQAWIHADFRTKNGLAVIMGGSRNSDDFATSSTHTAQEQVSIEPRRSLDRDTAPIELCLEDSNPIVYMEDMFPGVSPSNTGSTQRSYDSRSSGQDLNGHAR